MVRAAPRVDRRPRLAHAPSTEAIDLALAAVDVATGAVRRLMRAAGIDEPEIDNEAKRHKRLAERLRAGKPLREGEARFVAGALAIVAALHRTLPPGAGGRGPHVAAAFEQAARRFANLRDGIASGVLTPLPAANLLDEIGTRVVEVATGRAFWIDEIDPAQPDRVGVIPDEGRAEVKWMLRALLRRDDPTP